MADDKGNVKATDTNTKSAKTGDNSVVPSGDSVDEIMSSASEGQENNKAVGKKDAEKKHAEATPDLYVATEGAQGRDGGPYLDRERRREQEIINARRENREPDFENPALAPSTVLVTETQLRGAVQDEITVTPEIKGKPAK